MGIFSLCTCECYASPGLASGNYGELAMLSFFKKVSSSPTDVLHKTLKDMDFWRCRYRKCGLDFGRFHFFFTLLSLVLLLSHSQVEIDVISAWCASNEMK